MNLFTLCNLIIICIIINQYLNMANNYESNNSEYQSEEEISVKTIHINNVIIS